MARKSTAKTTQAISEPQAAAPVTIVSQDSYFIPYQDKWIDDDSPLKLAEKSRRVGFTYATSYRCTQKCLRRRNFTQWVSSRDQLTAQEFVTDYVARWCRLANVVARGIAGDNIQVFDERNDIKAYVVEFPTGSRIVSLSSTPEVFAGKGGDILLDEMDLHKDPAKLYDMARPCTTWGGQLEAISAYAVDGSPNSVFAKLCQDAKGANPMHASFHRVTIDDAIAQGFVECVNRVTGSTWTRESFREQIRAACRTEAAFQSQYMCNPQDDGGALLPYQLLYQCEATPDQIAAALGAAPDAPAYLGIDVGRRHDLSIFWLLRRVGDVLWTGLVLTLAKALFRDQFAKACELMETHNVRRCCIDATGIGAQLGEDLVLRYKNRVEAIQLNHTSQVDIGLAMLPVFQDRSIRIPADQVIREDLHKVRKTTTAANQVRLEAESDDAGHADRFWGCALGLHAAQAKSAYFSPRAFKRRGAGARRPARNKWEFAA